MQLVEGADGLIYGGLVALSDTLDYRRPVRLARQTEDSLFFTIWGRTKIKVDRTEQPMTGLAGVTKDKVVYPATLQRESALPDESWGATRELLPFELEMPDAGWLCPASGGSFYFRSQQKIYFAEAGEKNYKVKLLDYDTSAYHFYSIGLSPDEQTLLAHGTPRKDSMPGVGGGDIYELQLEGRTTVTDIRLLPPTVNTPTYDIFPAYTSDGDWLLTSYGKLEGADSSGRADLYVVERDGSARPLSAAINTPDAEAGAFMDRQGRFVLFHRNRRRPPAHPDRIMISRRTETGWSAPEPLSAPVNTGLGAWAPRISRDGRHLYFSSVFRGGWQLYRVPTAEVPELRPYFVAASSPLDGSYALKTESGERYALELVTATDGVVYGTIDRQDGGDAFDAPVNLVYQSPDSLRIELWYGDRFIELARDGAGMMGYANIEGDTVVVSLRRQSDSVAADLRASAQLVPLPLKARSPAFTAHKSDGRFYFVGWAGGNIFLAEESPAGWKQTPVFYDRSKYRFSSLGLSPNEQTLVAHGKRTDGDGDQEGGSIYLLHLADENSIARIEKLPATVNTPSYDNFPDFTPDGHILFSSWGKAAGKAGRGKGDLYIAERSGEGYKTKALSPALNTPLADAAPSLSPDGKLLLFYRSGNGMSDKVYFSLKTPEDWSEAIRLPHPVNVDHSGQYGARIDPAGRYLYWTSHHRGQGDLYRLPVVSIPVLNNLLKNQ